MNDLHTRRGILGAYVALTYLAVIANVAWYLRDIRLTGVVTPLFAVAAMVAYSAVYVLPVAACVGLVAWMSYRRAGPNVTASAVVVACAAVGIGAMLQFLLYVDRFVFHIYGFHLNGFVWNLVFTRGGMDSLGGGAATTWSIILIALGFVLLQTVLLFAAIRVRALRAVITPWLTRKRVMLAVMAFLCVFGMNQFAFGISMMKAYSPVLVAANAMPLYLPITFTNWARRLGVTVEDSPSIAGDVGSLRLNYPLAPIQRDASVKPLNIVWLVSESLRRDALDPTIMPNTWALAQRGSRFTYHYSGGNGTRMGMFAMFYGLYGNYWFPFLTERHGPVLFDVLREMNYQWEMFTSAAFTYPEFDKTIFSAIDTANLHEYETEPKWKRDEGNTERILKFINDRDPTRPFFTFMFFESPHAEYHFPAETAIRKPYLEKFDYATMNLERDMPLIRARYDNACHYLDLQLGRIFDDLQKRGLMDSTIVIVTGDHGEEFMEKGRWGHNSAFTEEQTRPPLVIWVPGRTPQVVTKLTSHLDISPTVLKLLGVTNSPDDFCLGHDLFGKSERTFTVIADWDSVTYVDPDNKAVFPLNAVGGIGRQRVTTRDDAEVTDRRAVYEKKQANIVQVMRGMKRFSK